jgi:Na+-transporting NADH:ubiquinone oxidoreductase subunit C
VTLNRKGPVYVVGYAAAISAVFTAAIASLQVATAGKVQLNERLRKEKQLVKLFGLADVQEMTDGEIARLVDRRIDDSPTLTDPQTGRTLELYRAYAADREPDGAWPADKLLGVGVPIDGPGFWSHIAGLIALTPDYTRVKGVVFLVQSETPGLGARITEPSFLNQFVPARRREAGQPELRSSPPEDPDDKFIYVGGPEPSGSADPRYARRVDAVTGATQTSNRVEDLINASLERFRRALEAQRRQAAPAGS